MGKLVPALQGGAPLSCRAEDARGLKTPIVGFLYKDTVGAGRQVLEEHGNPYDVVIFEEKNKVGIDLGVTGVPENLHHRQEGRHSRQGELSDSG